MISFDRMLDRLMPLSCLERAFQCIYENQLPYLHAEDDPRVRAILSEDPQALFIFERICNSLQADPLLSERIMFPPGIDVRVLVHMRYHPLIRHSHDFFEIQYVLKGKCRQTIASYDASLEEGDFCFISPHTSHTLYVLSEDTILVNLLVRRGVFPHAFLSVLADSDIISSFFLRALYSRDSGPFMINHAGADENIRFLIARMLENETRRDPYSPQFSRVLFEELFLHLLRDHSLDFTSEIYAKKNWRRHIEVLAYIQEHYDTVSLGMLSEKFGYNPSYLSRILKESLGKTYSQLLMDIRFDHALQLILTTNDSIEQIIAQVGYTDRTFFYQEFQRRYGMPPARYRSSMIVATP